ncbi:unnamed protein product [Ilex paraguariensis]|uniref:Uncharacterized protein n=1 Tax=Ilex paraguariensis TaxID=185542 RepID=A0ABC8UEX4_9AQUA
MDFIGSSFSFCCQHRVDSKSSDYLYNGLAATKLRADFTNGYCIKGKVQKTLKSIIASAVTGISGLYMVMYTRITRDEEKETGSCNSDPLYSGEKYISDAIEGSVLIKVYRNPDWVILWSVCRGKLGAAMGYVVEFSARASIEELGNLCSAY